MAAYKFGAVGMAGGIIAIAAVAAWFGLAHVFDPKGGEGVIAGQVQISPALTDQVRPTDVLFVIVRRPGGTPRPVAAKRIENPKFPVPFEITNADVMVQVAELRGWSTCWRDWIATEQRGRRSQGNRRRYRRSQVPGGAIGNS